MLKIGNVKVGIHVKMEDYSKILASHLNMRNKTLKNVKLLKRSVDARKADVHYICTFAFEVENEEMMLAQNKQVSLYQPYQMTFGQPIKEKTIVVGSGPAGLFCAWYLAKSGCPVVLLERGKCVEERINDIETFRNMGKLNTQSNIQFGEGGAGTFSDGKLSTGIKDPRIQTILETFVSYGATDDILYDALPHIGTDYLRKVIVNMRNDLINMGVDVRFNSQVTGLIVDNNKIKGVVVNNQETILGDHVVLAIGHSARDTFEMLYENKVDMQSKPFAVGLRVEHLQKDVNRIQYKKAANYLKAASYKAAYKASNGKGVYTFCMCPGGEVVPAASEEGMVVTNGMSEYARSKTNANSAILVSVDQSDFGSDHPLSGMYYQRELEKKAFALAGSNYQAPASTVGDYLNHTVTKEFTKIQPSYKPGVTPVDLHLLFSDEINLALEEGLVAFSKKLPFFKDQEAVLTGVESRSSSPVRFYRDEKGMSNILNLYPCGEGAGMAGGIISAAVDGLEIAMRIYENATKN